MIEIIYRGEDEQQTEDTDVRLPKNVRQIGDCEFENRKIYVEDFVMSYVKHFNSRNLKYGVLLGSIKHNGGNTYLFITGAVCARPMLDNEIIFDEDVWTSLYEDIKTYFEEVEILGWFLSMPGMLSNDMAQIQKIHLDNFAGNDKVCFLLDRLECEDSFYLYGDGLMKKCGGHYIYYEKNTDMQSYMVMNEEVSEVPTDYEQSRKRSINAKVHKLLYKVENRNTVHENSEYAIQPYVDNEADAADKDKTSLVKRRLPTFAYSASSFMLIAILLGAIAVMNASGQLNELKSVVAGIVKNENEAVDKKNPEDAAKIIEVAGNIETTTADLPQPTEELTQPAANQPTESQPVTEQPVTEPPANGEATEEQPAANQPTESQPETQPPAAEQTAEPTVVPAAKEPQYYKVKSGDSLYSISLRVYGTVSMIDKIMQANGISDENYIKEGDTILLP
ncbi:MAG: LysM peptidoglycan-binding domain-containing protein [Lachnospiraceae bacterium]|nr:LysM peptidoglycan-binding domain-containing protein [Lachnospiraceae bacterium]